MAATTVIAAFAVLKDHVKFKVNQNVVATDNLGNRILGSDFFFFVA